MRERRREDWATDLTSRHPLETQVGRAIDTHPALHRLTTSTSSLDRLGFQLLGPGGRVCELELKAKQQPYHGWAQHCPQVDAGDVFILDELALRRLMGGGRYAFLLIRDLPRDRWSVWSTVELMLAPKVRVTRRLHTGPSRWKGKVLLDLTDAAQTTSTLTAALSAVAHLVRVVDRRWHDIAPWPTRRTPPIIGAAS